MDILDKIKGLVELETSPKSINESGYENRLLQLMDPKMVEYMNDNLNDPARKEGYLRAVKRFMSLAEKETDPRQKLYYEFRVYLGANQARNLAREFYSRELKSGTMSNTGVSLDSEGDAFDVIDSVGYGNSFADKGMFANLTAKNITPERTLEIDDFFTKLFASPLLDEKDRLVLVTHLILGTGPNLRAKGGSNRQGMDLEAIMDNPPKELKIITDQIKKILKFGIDQDDLTRNMILYGVSKNDSDDPSAPTIPALISNKRLDQAIINIQNAMKKFVGIADIDDIKKYMIVEGNDDKATSINAIMDYLSGKGVTRSNLIKAIVAGVDMNIKKKTRLSKSTIFNASFSNVCKKYLELAQSGDDAKIYKVQDMLLAPVLDEKVLND